VNTHFFINKITHENAALFLVRKISNENEKHGIRFRLVLSLFIIFLKAASTTAAIAKAFYHTDD